MYTTATVFQNRAIELRYDSNRILRLYGQPNLSAWVSDKPVLFEAESGPASLPHVSPNTHNKTSLGETNINAAHAQKFPLGWKALVLSAGGTSSFSFSGDPANNIAAGAIDDENYIKIQGPNSADGTAGWTLTLPPDDGSNGQVLTTNGSGVTTWGTVSSSDTTYSTSWVDSSTNAILRLTAGGSGSGNDDLTIVAGSNITLTPSGDDLTIASTDTNTVYTHPTQNGADLDVDTGTLSGATVFSNLNFDMFSDGTGHITSAGSTIGTRNLTAGDVGAATSGHNHSGTYDNYAKWIINGVSTSGSTWITSGETVAFHGSGGISTSWSGTYNTLTISSTNSSQRYKENIENLTLDTAKIYNLVPRSFTWRNDPDDPVGNRLDGQSDFGLVAEEVHAIMPELVWNNDDDEIEGVKYMTLSVLLLAELKKLKARVDTLEGG